MPCKQTASLEDKALTGSVNNQVCDTRYPGHQTWLDLFLWHTTRHWTQTLLMIPPLSTTPSAPTITRSTFSRTYLRQNEQMSSHWRRVTHFSTQINKYIFYPTAASRTTVTGTLSFLRASAICRLNAEKIQWVFVPLQNKSRPRFTDSVNSPGWVRLRFGHIDREAFLLSCSFFQHPEDDSGVRVSQDFLKHTREKSLSLK